MCVISSAAMATALAGISATAASSGAVVASATVLANAALGAGLSAGVGAATGARGRDLAISAAIGGVTAGTISGAGMALSGITTLADAGTGPGGQVFFNEGGLLGKQSFSVQYVDASGNVIKSAAPAVASESLDYAALGLTAAQGAAEGYSSVVQGNEESKALKEQARLNNIRAGQAQDAAALEKMDLARRQKATIGRGKAAAAASGIMLESRAEASPSVWEEDARAELAYEGSKIAHNANLQAWGYQQNANVDMMNARTARRTGNLKAATSLIKAGAGMYTTAYGKPGTSLFA